MHLPHGLLVNALRHPALRDRHKPINDLVESLLDLAAEHHLHHQIEVGMELDVEICPLRPVGDGVEMQRAAETERSPVVNELYHGIWDPVPDHDPDLKPLDGGGDGVIVSLNSLTLVLREHLKEIPHVHEGHIKFKRRLRDDPVFAYYVGIHIL